MSLSPFTVGMQPLLFSVKDAVINGRRYWVRTGASVNYYRNHFARAPITKCECSANLYRVVCVIIMGFMLGFSGK